MTVTPARNASPMEKPMHAPELRGIDQILSLANNGDYLPDLLQRLEALMTEMRDFSEAYGTAAAGSLTLKLGFKLDRFGQIEMTVDDDIKVPKPPKAKAVAWTTEGGRLTPHNPAQTRMEIRDVGGTRELRTPNSND
ncbi:hypothetical protein [Halodurantibacterium flavum]|uniref:Amphi-Trp domain-containing protein n=1 Tax=Halodurantibacterium flavum TaxID=1382802 RepID=A0ABW4S8B3_9RHOB